jgi:hypothetical protein
MVALGVLLCVCSAASGAVLATVFHADGQTPLESADPNMPFVYRDIMVGTKLTIIVSSDAAENWDGRLWIEGSERKGIVSTRDPNDVTPNREGSIFKAAGERATVRPVENSVRAGFDMKTIMPRTAGEWFIFDYTATNVGLCRVDFCEQRATPQGGFDPDDPDSEPEPALFLLQELVFSHVRTRDFNGDTKVDFIDFATMMAFRGVPNCAELNACEGTDLDVDGDVDSVDLMMFADHWLERTE